MIADELLRELGIVDWGYTEESVPRSFERFSEWLKAGNNGPLNYLSGVKENRRSDLRIQYPPFQSALTFLFSYRPAKKWLLENERHEIAAYALGFGGEDYHPVIRKRLRKILATLVEAQPDLEAALSVDTEAVMERDLALRAGLGWFGKNSMLINRQEGSYFIIGSILLNKKLDLPVKPPVADHCGQCRACVEACPTLAIDEETRTVKADRCISTFTIEIMKDVAPPAGMENSRGEIFGCDICQDVCPWNAKPLTRTPASLSLEKFPSVGRLFASPPEKLLEYFESQTGRGVKKELEGTALSRPGKRGWIKNLKFVTSSRSGS